MNSKELYKLYQEKMQRIADIKYATAVLQWDQETYLPLKGNTIRGQQIATLSELAHQEFTDEQTGTLLHKMADKNDLDEKQQKNVELSLYDYHKSKKLPGKFVRLLSETVTRSFHAWVKARKENSFAVFQNPLDELIKLKRQEAELLGYETDPYNALMNDYDKGLTVAIVDQVFADLKSPLTTLLNAIQQSTPVDNSFLHQHFDKDQQWQLGLDILKQIDFDFEAGRQDISEHPFTINFNSQDVRITTRIDEYDFGNMLWSCLHEGGHALYEQGLPADQYGLPLGEYCSLSIHESQSRLWENNVGRSRAFCDTILPVCRKYFPKQFREMAPEQFFRVINKIQPSLIRTEADELTYHLHVIIRYEMEKLLIDSTIEAADIPAYWNELYAKHLGIQVPDDRQGCLQDVHWSHGSFGYFATYSLGSLYAAQLYTVFTNQHPAFENELASGNFTSLLHWLRQQVHGHGRYYTSEELCKLVTGEGLNSNYFTAYANKKYAGIYNI